MNEKCAICGKDIKVTNSQYKKSKTKIFTCSRKCMILSRKKPNNTKCTTCGKEFRKIPSKLGINNFCSLKCIGVYQTGEGNPNKKYHFDENFFKDIDTEFKAWFVGWIASDGCISNNRVTLSIHKHDLDVLEIIQNNFCKDIQIKSRKSRNMISYEISSKVICNDLLKILNLNTDGKKSNRMNSVNISNDLILHFIRGYFEGDGSNAYKRQIAANITSNSIEMLNFINEKVGNYGYINVRKDGCGRLTFTGVNALDFLGKIYDYSNFKMLRIYQKYLDISTWEKWIGGKGSKCGDKNISFCKTRKDAVLPFKERVSDSGYDLTLISLEKKIGEVELYDTGIKVSPPFGFYFDLVPRSSIIKSGYILANSVGIIDRSYLGAIKVPLIKIDNNKPDLALPSRLVQIIPRRIIHANIVEVDNLENTSRGDGGFGSTNKENNNE